MPLRVGAGLFVAVALVLQLSFPAAGQEQEFTLTLKGHQFQPAELTVPAGVRIKLTVKNEDPTPAEFESAQLRREKVVAAGAEGIVYVGPLAPGAYEFFDDFNPKTRGRLLAR